MKTEIRTITPKLADELLKLNKSNRRLKQSTISGYVKDMKSGNWKLTGEAIKVSKNKVLLDGQHRLHAISRSGVAVDILVISDLEDSVFNVLDTGSNRTAGDILSINGIENSSITAAASRFVLNYHKGLYTSKSNDRVDRPRNYEIQSFVEKNIEILEISDWVAKNTKKFKLLTPSVIAGMLFVLSKINVTDADKYFQKLIFGLDLKEDCPIGAFRERLIRDQINKSRLPMPEKISLMVNSWNHFRKGTTVKKLVATQSIKAI